MTTELIFGAIDQTMIINQHGQQYLRRSHGQYRHIELSHLLKQGVHYNEKKGGDSFVHKRFLLGKLFG